MKILRQTPLFWRLFFVCAAVTLVDGTLRTWLFLREERATQMQAIDLSITTTATLLGADIAELAITGDYASIQDQLRRRVTAHPMLQRAEWRLGKARLAFEVPPLRANYPAWFARLTPLFECTRTTQVSLGGTDYGTLILTCDPVHPLNIIWQRMVTQAGVSAGALALLFLLLALALRSSLMSLFRLTEASQRFITDLGTRTQVGGSRELRELGLAFNAMAEKIESTLAALQTTRAELQREATLNHVTLMSIGDAVITTDAEGYVTQLNPVAESMTGWSQAEAQGKPIDEVFRIISEETGEPAVNPTERVLREGVVLGLANHTALIARDGHVTPIEDSAAPIRSAAGEILGCVLVFHDVSEKRAWQTEIGWQATHDALTGLPNRMLLADRLDQSLARARREDGQTAVALIDLDEFKPVNDRLGHAAGDALLREVARRMQEMLRETDTLARLGGDELALVLSDLSGLDEAKGIFDRLLARLTEPYQIEDEEIRISASIGYTLFPQDNADGDTLLRHADQAMYAAKRAGRNRHFLFDAQHDMAQSQQRERMEVIRQALESGQFEMFYQPKVNMRHGRIMGFEALARWRHPQQGLLPPGTFLPFMEDHLMGSALGRFALDAALTQIAAWQAAGHTWEVAVNITPQHFTSPHFLTDLEAALAAHPQADPQLLTLEIVESAAMADLEQAARVIATCNRLKINVAVDDFGVGYASLTYLKRLPVDVLKIDQSFVRDVLDDAGDLALVEAIIALSTVFGRSVVAEGVETSEHGVLLMRLGCDVAQGYGIARPMPAADVLPWAAGWQPDPSWALWADTKWEMSDFPLLVAQYDHLRWVKNVINTLEGSRLTLSHQELVDHHSCRLGHWYDTHGKQRYGHLPAFREMYPVHELVHVTGREVLRLKEMGDMEAARAKAQELLALKDRILGFLSRLQTEVASSTHAPPNPEAGPE